ncbi:MAG: glycosyltransferase family protein [Solirubrobacterales bacterium]
MRILYGVNGEGMGHATRSRVVIDALLADHDVRVVASGAAFAYLSDCLPRVDEVFGPTFAMEEGEIHRWATVVQNVRNARRGVPDTVHNWVRVVDKTWRPEVVITDFEPLAGIYARSTRTPMIAVDNINMLDRCRHDAEIIGKEREDFLVARAVTRSMVPGAVEYVVTTFFKPPIERGGTILVPPIVRPEIESAVTERGEHLVVYSSGEPALIEALRASGVRCLVYGMRGGPQEGEVDGNLEFRPRSNEGFVEDLRTARGVVAGGGFSLLSEAVYLGKPVLAMPLHGQFEQLMNARYLEREGYGVCAPEVTPEVLDDFLGRLEEFEQALARYHQDGNTVTLQTIEARASAVVAAQPRELRHERRTARRRVQ